MTPSTHTPLSRAKQLTRGKRWLYTAFTLAFFGLFVYLAADVALRRFVSNPATCKVCHYEAPYVRQWETSSHNKVPCVKCHDIGLGFLTSVTLKMWTGPFNPRPRAVVQDARCMAAGCHSERLLQGKVLFKGAILFDHAQHVGKLKRGEHLRCQSCHSQIVQGQHIAVTEEVCFLCHFKGAAEGTSVTGCPSCHGTPSRTVEHDGFSFRHDSYLKLGVACNQCHLKVASGTGDVPEEACYSCHVERADGRKDLYKLHQIHITEQAIQCFRCHQKISHGEVKMIQALEIQCETCHVKLHGYQKELYMGVSGRGVQDTPSRMFAAQVSCDGCHRSPTNPAGAEATSGQSDMVAMASSCVECHGPGYDKMLDDWRRGMKELTDAFEPALAGARAALSSHAEKMAPADRSRAEELVGDAEYNFHLVKEGHGVHNVEYAVRVIRAAWDRVDEALGLGLSSAPGAAKCARPAILQRESAYCRALCHDRIGLPEKVYFEDMRIEFPHRTHAEQVGVECVVCHSAEKHKMRIISKEECMNCHHGSSQATDCSRCHPDTVKLYKGEGIGVPGVQNKPSVMAAAAIGCDGCHDLAEKGHSVERLKGKCVECHQEGYDRMLIEWERELLAGENTLVLRVERVRDSIERARKLGRLEAQAATKQFDEAERAYNLVQHGKGVHNIDLSRELYQLVAAKLGEAETVLAKAAP